MNLFLYSSDHHRDLHSFPTRRSSDLLHDDTSQQLAGLAIALSDLKRRMGAVQGNEDLQGDMVSLQERDRKSTRLNSSHSQISYAVFCLKKKKLPYGNSWFHTSPPVFK